MKTTEAATPGLLTCPFCGSENIKTHCYGQHIGGEPDAFCQCHDCSVAGPSGADEAEAIAAWNCRAALSASQQADRYDATPSPAFDRMLASGDPDFEAAQSDAAPLQAAQPGWISIDERLPENGARCLVYTPESKDKPDRIDFEYFCDGCWHMHNDHYEHFTDIGGSSVGIGPSADAPYTHWMLLPAAPTTKDSLTVAAPGQADGGGHDE